MPVLCVLPARIGSQRLPRKPLQRIAGRTLVEWSWRAATRVPEFDAVWVATDSEEVAAVVAGFGGVPVLTGSHHASGTDRVAEAAGREEARGFEVVVNFQADEPFLEPGSVSAAVRAVRDGGEGVATLAVPLGSRREWESPDVVKVARAADGRALYFSRAPIPWPRDGGFPLQGDPPTFLRHVGVYAYGRDALRRWGRTPPTRLERVERLEQLRALESGLRIQVLLVPEGEGGVDTPADVERAERLLRVESGR